MNKSTQFLKPHPYLANAVYENVSGESCACVPCETRVLKLMARTILEKKRRKEGKGKDGTRGGGGRGEDARYYKVSLALLEKRE